MLQCGQLDANRKTFFSLEDRAKNGMKGLFSGFWFDLKKKYSPKTRAAATRRPKFHIICTQDTNKTSFKRNLHCNRQKFFIHKAHPLRPAFHCTESRYMKSDLFKYTCRMYNIALWMKTFMMPSNSATLFFYPCDLLVILVRGFLYSVTPIRLPDSQSAPVCIQLLHMLSFYSEGSS